VTSAGEPTARVYPRGAKARAGAQLIRSTAWEVDEAGVDELGERDAERGLEADDPVGASSNACSFSS
jgi:hypothetical protein